MPAAARVGDSTSHVPVAAANPTGVPVAPPTGVVMPPLPPPPGFGTVLIGGRPAAVTGSVHQCTVPQHAPLGPANRVIRRPGPGSVTRQVLIHGLPAASVGDMTTCGASVASGAPNVQIGGTP
ncbi:PAAR domain-containing protein [Amycolatopsis nigrescens]|uniref:PAAR domain-containing protein n=1 Tax=Amycolatopsis nigrescens TaxID=381445 RepID=UPI000368CD72|nr:PAAR domain-containing protein [Amycolatopsis nigrescens]